MKYITLLAAMLIFMPIVDLFSQVPFSDPAPPAKEQMFGKSSPKFPSTVPPSLPATLSYQGLLTTSLNAPVTDGSYGLQFDLFDSLTGGSSQWTETHNGVAVQRGTFSLIMGSINQLNVNFNRKLYVEIKALNGPAGPSYPLTFSPRSELTSAPSSLAPWSPSGNDIYFNSGHIGIGTPTPGSNGIGTLKMEIADSNGLNSDVAIRVAGTGYPIFHLAKSRGPLSTPTSVMNADALGQIIFDGYNGSSYQWGASIYCIVDSVPTLGAMPGRLDFYTTNTKNSFRRTMSLDRNGNLGIPFGYLGIGTTTPLSQLDVKGNNPVRILGDLSTLSGSEYVDFMARSFTFSSDIGGIRIQRDSLSGDVNTSIFAAANGTSASEKMRIDGNGNVGIGTMYPSYRLHVAGVSEGISIQGASSSFTNEAYMTFRDISGIRMGYVGDGSTIDSDVFLDSDQGDVVLNTQAGRVLTATLTGNVGIGTTSPSQKLQVAGNICATGTIGTCSDIRYKKDIAPLTSSLNNVLLMRGVSYRWKAEEFPKMNFSKEKQIGLIAQEVEKIYPEIVQTDADGYKSVDYARLAPVLIEAIKEQQKQIEELKAMMKSLVDKQKSDGDKSLGELK